MNTVISDGLIDFALFTVAAIVAVVAFYHLCKKK
jgi:hypothetical protein